MKNKKTLKERLSYIWRYYIRPPLFGINPNSHEGIRIRIAKLQEDHNVTNKVAYRMLHRRGKQ